MGSQGENSSCSSSQAITLQCFPKQWLVSVSVWSNHGRDRMFGFREQGVSLYCQSKHLGLQITTSLVVYRVCYARIGCEDALHGNKRGQYHYPAIVNSVTVLKTLVQYLPSSKMSNACQFVDLDASVTRKSILRRQQFSFSCWGPDFNHRTNCYQVTFRWTRKLLKSCSDAVTRIQTSILVLRHFKTKSNNSFLRARCCKLLQTEIPRGI